MHAQAIVTECQGGKYVSTLQDIALPDLGEGEVLVKVLYSSLNYKDALSAAGNKGVTRRYPHVPGIDACGVVEQSLSTAFSPGDTVIITGYDFGMNTNGGLATYAVVQDQWLIPKPATLSAFDCMLLGTAGLTAVTAIDKLLRNEISRDRPIAVTGASGGVGSWAITLLLKSDFEVIAVSSKEDVVNIAWPGSNIRVLSPQGLLAMTDRALGKPAWGAGIDTLGGPYLDQLLRCCDSQGSIATCGLAASSELVTSVFPFILRGVNLLGVDSVELPLAEKQRHWHELAASQNLAYPAALTQNITLSEVPAHLELFPQGKVAGRIVVDMNPSF